MKLIRREEGTARQGTTFTGETTLTGMLHAQREGGISLSVVHFQDGARTHWHVHPGEQVLYVLKGEGRVATETEELRLRPGDVVYAPPGEKHWHGAAPDHSMKHLSITTQGAPEWLGAPED